MKKIIIAILTCALFICLVACGNKSSSISANTIHNSQLGLDVSLGMDKTEIDSMLGDPVQSSGFFVYSDSGLTVAYAEGKAVMLVVTDYVWKSINNTSIEITADELKTLCGEQSSYSSDDSYSYLYDKKSKSVQDKDDAATVIMYSITDSKVESYSITDLTFGKE